MKFSRFSPLPAAEQKRVLAVVGKVHAED
jgi:hypothetical protein